MTIDRALNSRLVPDYLSSKFNDGGECTTYSNSGHYLNLNIAIFTSYESFIHIVIYSGKCKLANLKMLEHCDGGQM